MIEIKSKLRKWGNSFGIVLPREFINNEGVKEGEEVIVLLKKEGENVLKETFGLFRFKKSTQELLDEVDKELWDL